jgi:predicted lipoprotein with Yx(FWY)xxD motif
MIRRLLAVGAVAALGSGAAIAASAALNASTPAVKAVSSAKFGKVLVAANGKTLYRYTVDSKGVNRCTGDPTCNKYWPPLLVKATAKPTAGTGVNASLLGTIKAKGGMRQVTYAGFPLYMFAGDAKAGQTSGEGFESKWYVVSTKGALVKHAVTSGSGSTPAPPANDPGYGTTTTGGSAWG